jgi:hypothetical protein
MLIQDRNGYRAESIRMTRIQATVHRERQVMLQRQARAVDSGLLIWGWALALVVVLVWIVIPLVWLLMVPPMSAAPPPPPMGMATLLPPSTVAQNPGRHGDGAAGSSHPLPASLA